MKKYGLRFKRGGGIEYCTGAKSQNHRLHGFAQRNTKKTNKTGKGLKPQIARIYTEEYERAKGDGRGGKIKSSSKQRQELK